MSSFLAIARRLAVLGAWLVIFAAGGLLVLEESGVLVGLLRHRIAQRLGPLGDGLAIERVTLRWFEPGVVIEGVSLSSTPEDGRPGQEMLRLRHIHVSLAMGGEHHAPVRRLHVDGGRVRVSDELLYGFDRIASSLASTELKGGFLAPRMLFSHINVVLQLPSGASLDLGRVDLAADPVGDGAFDLRGQLLPTLAGAMPARVAVLIDGHQDEDGLEVHASARDLLLSTRGFELPPGMAELPVDDFEGRLTLDGDARLDWSSGTVRVSGEARASISEAELTARAGIPPLEGLGIELDTHFLPRAGGGLWDRSSWSATAHAAADWGSSRCTAWGTFGKAAPKGALAKTWVRLDELDIGPELEATLAPLGPAVEEIWTAFGLRGSVDATLDVTLPSYGADSPYPPPAIAVHVASRGAAGATYHGLLDAHRGERFGIPLPVEGIEGDLIGCLDTGSSLPWRLGFIDVTGRHPSGVVEVEGQVSQVSEPTDHVPVQTDLRIRVPSIAIDDALRESLSVNRETAAIWNDFAPEGGTASSEWRLRQSKDTNGTTARGDVTVHGTSVAWRQVPVRLAPVSGQLSFRWGETPIPLTDVLEREGAEAAGLRPGARTRPFGAAYDFALDEPAAGGLEVAVRGFARADYTGLDSIAEAQIDERFLDELEVEIRELGLRGAAWDVLAERFEDVGRNAVALGAKGRVNASYRGTRARPEGPYHGHIEVVPTAVELSPLAFPLRTRDLAGRILVESTTAGDGGETASVTRADVSGTWPGGARLLASGRLGAADESLSVHALGLDLANQAVRGAIERVRSLDERGQAAPSEDSTFEADTLQGKLDARVALAPAPEGVEVGAVELFLRENRFAGDELLVDGLVGRLTMSGDGFRAPRLEARLGDTPIGLRNVVLARLGELSEVSEADEALGRSGFWSDPEGLLFQAELELRDLSLAPEDLTRWLPPEPGRDLGEAGSWTGLVDVDGARLVVTRERDGGGRVLLRGPSRFHGLDLRLGLPIAVQNAELDVHELVLEAGRLRGWASVLDLDADIAARELRDAQMIVSYVDGRLTIDRLQGKFAGGRLSSLGGDEPGGTGLAVELVRPHAFDLYLRLDDVRVDRLLRGVFHSTIADAGLLTARLRLQGTPEDVLGLTGSGWLRLEEARLWSIPVVRELFGRLGMDETATFDSLHSRFRLRNGRLRTPYLDVRSSLLHLVGDGTIDLDGDLEYDLEARYSLLDGLGLFSKLVYFLNNSLWRVAVRGDMNRPRVFLRNAFLELLRGFHEPERHSLPLPPFTSLPPRF